jgi:DNA-binding beta-propeller fold protein YncE
VRGRSGALAVLAALALCTPAACGQPDAPGAAAPLILERTIPLPDVDGRIDHLAVDLAHDRLFVAALGNGSVEAIDLHRGAPAGRIPGLEEPQGLAYLPARDELVVASGGDGTVRFYRGPGLDAAGEAALGEDADNVRVDPAAGRVVVGYGSGLAVIDPGTRAVVSRLQLPGHPEGFRLDPSSARVFVNVPSARTIVTADLAAGRIVSRAPTAHLFNFPMALDAASGTLAVVYRLPARLSLIDAASGKVRQDVGTCGDADDVFFDPRRARLYVVCGAGAVEAFERSAGGYRSIGRIATRAGARTGLFAPELDRLYVAARRQGTHQAAILVYRPGR